MDDATVATVLRDLAETPAPPSRVDVARAARAGRRRVRARRLAGAGSAAAGVVAVVAAVGLLTPATPASREPGTTPAAAAPSRFDPLVQYADFGWLPDGVAAREVSVRREWLHLAAYWSPEPGQSEGAAVRLFLTAAGHSLDEFLTPPAEPAPVWSSPVPPSWFEPEAATVVRWEYAPQAWAAVAVSLPGADPEEVQSVAERVAGAVQYGVDDRVELPFATTGIPGQLQVVQAGMHRYDGGWLGGVTYDDGDPTNGDRALTIAVMSSEGTVDSREPNTTVDGHPAWADENGVGGSSLVVFDVDGVFVELRTQNRDATALLPAGLEGLFRATEFYADPADWR